MEPIPDPQFKLNLHYQKFNPFRTPDWRWSRVLHLCDRHPTPGRCTKWDDGYVKIARRFLLLWRKCETDAEREILFWEQPGLVYALKIYENAQLDFKSVALFVEARLLTRETYADIAEGIGTIPSAIDWYEALFFNVRPYLKNRDWVISHVLMPSIMRYRNGNDKKDLQPAESMFSSFKSVEIAVPFLDATLKLFAYYGGHHLLEHLITGFNSGEQLEHKDQLSQWYNKAFKSTLSRRVTQAMHTIEINKYNATELFQIHTAVMAIDISADNIDAQKSNTERHIEAMLQDIPWAVGVDAEMLSEGTLLGEWDKSAVELRDEEVLRISDGQKVDIGDVPKQIPPPRKKGPQFDAAGSFTPPEKG